MKRIFFFFFTAFIFSTINAQEEIINRYTSNEIIHSFNVVDKETGNFALFIEEYEYVHGILFNKDKREIGRVQSSDLPNKYKEIIGYLVDGKTIILIMNTKNGRSYGVLKFDFEKSQSTVEELEFKLKKKSYLEALSIGNSFYLFSNPNQSNQINIYEFKSDLSSTLHEIQFKKEAFIDSRDKPINFYNIFFDIKKIENKIPVSIETSSEYIKLYNDGKKVTITSDRYKSQTFLINIDLENYNYSTDRVIKPSIADSYMGLKTNSFLLENNLFQIVANSKQLNIQITDLDTKSIVKKYSVNKDDPIPFKNSFIVQEGGGFDKYRELEKTSQFIRKISKAHAGISVLKQDDIFQITYGSALEKMTTNDYAVIGVMVGGLSGGIILASINTITTSYYGYSGSKSVRVTGLFDENFSHIEGEVPLNIFDRIKIYAENIKGIQAETIINLDDIYLFGYYNKRKNVYRLVKFSKN